MRDHQRRIYDSIRGLLCDTENPTPLVRLNRVVPFEHAQVYAKLEWYNPFGAVKDRIAANMIADAEERGGFPGQDLRVGDRCQLLEPHSVLELPSGEAAKLQGQASFPGPAEPC